MHLLCIYYAFCFLIKAMNWEISMKFLLPRHFPFLCPQRFWPTSLSNVVLLFGLFYRLSPESEKILLVLFFEQLKIFFLDSTQMILFGFNQLRAISFLPTHRSAIV